MNAQWHIYALTMADPSWAQHVLHHLRTLSVLQAASGRERKHGQRSAVLEVGWQTGSSVEHSILCGS